MVSCCIIFGNGAFCELGHITSDSSLSLDRGEVPPLCKHINRTYTNM